MNFRLRYHFVGAALVCFFSSNVTFAVCEFLSNAQQSQIEETVQKSNSSDGSSSAVKCESSTDAEVEEKDIASSFGEVQGLLSKFAANDKIKDKLHEIWGKDEKKVTDFINGAAVVSSSNNSILAKVYNSINFLSDTLNNYKRGPALSAETEKSKRIQMKDLLSKLLAASVSNHQLSACLQSKKRADQIVPETLKLESAARPKFDVRGQIERDLLDPRGNNAFIEGLSDKGEPQSISKLFADSKKPKSEFLDELLNQMAAKITDEQLGSDLDKLRKNISQIIKPPKNAPANPEGDERLELKKDLALVNLFMATQTAFNTFTLLSPKAPLAVAIKPVSVIHLNTGSKKPPEVTGQSVLVFKKRVKDAKNDIPAAVLEFQTSCAENSDCNTGNFNTTLYADQDKDYLDKYVKPYR